MGQKASRIWNMLVTGTEVQRYKASFTLADRKLPPIIFVFLREGENSSACYCMK